MKTGHNQIKQLNLNYDNFRTKFSKTFLPVEDTTNGHDYQIHHIRINEGTVPNSKYQIPPETYNFEFLDLI